MSTPDSSAVITVRDLTMAFGERVLMRDLNFEVGEGEIFVVMGGSGSGKTTLLRHMVGLIEPATGAVFYGRENFTAASPAERGRLLQGVGVMYQSGALWSSMTLIENVSLPLEEYTDLSPDEVRDLAGLSLALVGLRGFEDYYPAEISGGMQKRAGLARAMALGPRVLFVDEPSAGLDPISSSLLDDLLMTLRDSLGETIIVVTHELQSIFAIGTNSIFLDPGSQSIIARGPPKELRDHSDNPIVRRFLHRGRDNDRAPPPGRDNR